MSDEEAVSGMAKLKLLICAPEVKRASISDGVMIAPIGALLCGFRFDLALIAVPEFKSEIDRFPDWLYESFYQWLYKYVYPAAKQVELY